MNNNLKIQPTDNGHIIYPLHENNAALIHTAALLTISSLWPMDAFSDTALHNIAGRISPLLAQTPDPYHSFLQYCRSVLLLREQLAAEDGLPCTLLPCEWTPSLPGPGNCPGNPEDMPLHWPALKALPEAALAMTEGPAGENFSYWLTWFKERNAPGTLQQFILFTAYLHAYPAAL